jgi:hypothetical protein
MERRFCHEEEVSVEKVVSVLQQAEVGVPVVEEIRKAGIREMHFPDTGVIIPCSVCFLNYV